MVLSYERKLRRHKEYKKQIKVTVIKSGNSSRIYLSTSDNICYQELSTEEGGCIHDDNI